MNISVFGMGYVGVVAAACLAKSGHTVIGVDPNQTKIDLLRAGKSPIVEKDIGEIIEEVSSQDRLSATTDTSGAIAASDIALVCVGTPSQINGALDLKYIRQVCEQIGAALRNRPQWFVVVIRSTILPGTMHELVIPVLEQSSGKRAGVDFGVCNNPEFLREGTAVFDYFNPPKTVIGATDSRSADLLKSLYVGIPGPLVVTEVKVAEMVKYVDNVWHAAKVAFANEIGNFCKSIDVDSHKVMDIFCQDTKLNLSPYYLKPGFAFGGSCLPKDVRALLHKAKRLEVSMPVINALLPSNEGQIDRAYETIMARGVNKIGVLGFSFKAGTDDMRESPVISLIERLIGKGKEITLYDKNVNMAALTGANRDFILNQVPHIGRLMRSSAAEVVDQSELIIIGNAGEEFLPLVQARAQDRAFVDLVRLSATLKSEGKYWGICW